MKKMNILISMRLYPFLCFCLECGVLPPKCVLKRSTWYYEDFKLNHNLIVYLNKM